MPKLEDTIWPEGKLELITRGYYHPARRKKSIKLVCSTQIYAITREGAIPKGNWGFHWDVVYLHNTLGSDDPISIFSLCKGKHELAAMIKRCPKIYSTLTRNYLLSLPTDFFSQLRLKDFYELMPKEKNTDKDWVDELVSIYLKPNKRQGRYLAKMASNLKKLLAEIDKINNAQDSDWQFSDFNEQLALWLKTDKGQKYVARKPFELQYKLISLQPSLLEKQSVAQLIKLFEKATAENQYEFIGDLSTHCFSLSTKGNLSDDEKSALNASLTPMLITFLAQSNGRPYFGKSILFSGELERKSLSFPAPNFFDDFSSQDAYRNLTLFDKLNLISMFKQENYLRGQAIAALRDMELDVEQIKQLALRRANLDWKVKEQITRLLQQLIAYHRQDFLDFFECYLISDSISDCQFENLFADIAFALTPSEFDTILEHNINDKYKSRRILSKLKRAANAINMEQSELDQTKKSLQQKVADASVNNAGDLFFFSHSTTSDDGSQTDVSYEERELCLMGK